MNQTQSNLTVQNKSRVLRLRRKRLLRRKDRAGSVEMEAVLITGLMFPLAVALYYMAIRAFAIFYKLIAGILEWPYL